MAFPTAVALMHETAAQHSVTRIPVAEANETVAMVTARLHDSTYDNIEFVWVVDPHRRLYGAVSLQALLGANPTARIGTLMRLNPVRVPPECDQERVALAALRGGLSAVPVVDGENRLLGVVPSAALLQILHREHVEDLHRLAGIARESQHVRESLESPPMRRARDRLPWLLVGLAGSMLAAFLMSRFEYVLEQKLAVSFFVPAIVYLADAIGTQTEAVVVRGLSLSHQPLRRLLSFELGTGMLMGGALGLLAIAAICATYRDVRLAISVGTAVLAAGTAATSIGLLLPWTLQRAGVDPAFGSGPLATIIQDVLSLLIYFAIATALIR